MTLTLLIRISKNLVTEEQFLKKYIFKCFAQLLVIIAYFQLQLCGMFVN